MQNIFQSTFFTLKFDTVVGLLLQHQDIDVNRENSNGLSPLMEASKYGYNKVVEPILFHPNVQVNKATWDDGTTALMYACQNNHITVVKILLRCPQTDVHLQNNKFETAKEIAGLSSNINSAFENHTHLLNNGHTCCSGQMKKGLQMAAINNDSARIVNFLGCNGIELNKGYDSGRTPLYIASREGYFEIVQHLLKITEIDVNQNVTGETALIMAADRGYTNIVSLLLEIPIIDTNINKRGSEGSALFFASVNGHSMIVKKLLMQPQIEVNGAYGPERHTSLIAASSEGLTTVVKLLLMCPKTNMTLKNFLGQTAFNVSGDNIKEILNNRTELLKGNHTCCINANITLLSIAKVGDNKGIRGLAKCPKNIIDINIQDLRGRTGLYLASWMGYLDAVNEFLFLLDIDVNKGRNLTGQTPYSIASRKSNFDVMKTLIRHRNVDVNAGWLHDSWTTTFDEWQQLTIFNVEVTTISRVNVSKVTEIGEIKLIFY